VDTGDLDDDGDLDVLFGGDVGTFDILLNDGTGSLEPGVVETIPFYGHDFHLVDLDADAVLDVVVTGEGMVSVALGIGDGDFETASTFVQPTSLHATVLADLDENGTIDLATLDPKTPALVVAPGLGDGSFDTTVVSPLPLQAFDSVGIGGLAEGDLDRDGTLDLAVARGLETDEELVLMRGLGGLVFEAAKTLHIGPGPSAVRYADVNGDGQADLVSAIGYDNAIRIALYDPCSCDPG
jgi:hypothetical protein